MRVVIFGDGEQVHVRVIESVRSLGIGCMGMEISYDILDAIERGEISEIVFVPGSPVQEVKEEAPVKGRKKKTPEVTASLPPRKRRPPIRFVPLIEETVHVPLQAQQEVHERPDHAPQAQEAHAQAS